MATKIGVLEASRVHIQLRGQELTTTVLLVYTDWTPVDFAYPLVTPVAEVLDQITPRPYRPYKPGRYQSASIYART